MTSDRRISRRALGLTAAAGALLGTGAARAQAPQFFRIGTGSAGGQEIAFAMMPPIG